MNHHHILKLSSALAVGVLVTGCGSGGSATSSLPASSGTGSGSSQTQPIAAGGDIPDNQVFLVYRSPAGYSMKYPEGWAVSRSGGTTVIRDKNNLIRIAVAAGVAPTSATVRAEMTKLHAATPSLRAGSPIVHPTCTYMGQTYRVPRAAVRVDYSTLSQPDPVTGTRATLLFNRYYLPHAGKVAVLDLGTPQGVDNVDSFCLIAESFRWG